MKDEKDLEEMGELVRVLEKAKERDGGDGKCFMCPLHYDTTHVRDECLHIHRDMGVNLMIHDVQCRKVIDRKIEEVTRYMFERSLKDEG